MSAPDLSMLGAGFSSEALGSQAVFRAVLQALSHPGTVVEVSHDAEVPVGAQSASAAALLALLDSDCSVWLSPALQAAGAWLRFHTGCEIVADAANARFVWVARGDAMPALGSLAQGSDAYPDQTATCIVEVDQLQGDGTDGWGLSGPGVKGEQRLRAQGLPQDWATQWAANHAAFPRGVDVLLAAGAQLVGMPRTTALRGTVEA